MSFRGTCPVKPGHLGSGGGEVVGPVGHRLRPRRGSALWFCASPGDWRSGSALRSHRRGHWFEPSIAHPHSRRSENHLTCGYGVQGDYRVMRCSLTRCHSCGNLALWTLKSCSMPSTEHLQISPSWTRYERAAPFIPTGPAFGSPVEYDDLRRTWAELLPGLPTIDGWTITEDLPDIDDIGRAHLEYAESGSSPGPCGKTQNGRAKNWPSTGSDRTALARRQCGVGPMPWSTKSRS